MNSQLFSYRIQFVTIDLLQLSCASGVMFFPYQMDGCGTCVISDPGLPRATPEMCMHPDVPTLARKLKAAFAEVDEDNRLVTLTALSNLDSPCLDATKNPLPGTM